MTCGFLVFPVRNTMINQYDTTPDHALLTRQKPAASSKKPRQKRQSHGFSRQLRSRYTADRSHLDGRSVAAQAMASYSAELVASLGGADNLSAQELTLIEIAAKDWLLLQSIDAYLFAAWCIQ